MNKLRASVIIPAYNSRERLYLNLVALNNQTYEDKDIEIIVVDNGSTDDTYEMLCKFNMKYPFKKVRVKTNQGIAFGRNEGIKRASGDILIFHDSDMVASKDFIKKHILAHTEKNMVVCGMPWKRIYSFYYKNFSDAQMAKFNEMVNSTSSIGDITTLPDAYQLVDEEMVSSFNLEDYVFDLDIAFIKELKELVARYGNDFKDYYLPWRFFITNNLSVERAKVLKVGMFDSKIKKYGYEDYDLGVRLYKSGCRFRFADDILSIHQEHPSNFTYLDLIENISYICEKYNNISFIDMVMVCISDTLLIDGNTLNNITRDIYHILWLGQYNFILELFLELLQLHRKRIFNLPAESSTKVFSCVTENMPVVLKQAFELKHIHKTKYFISQLSRFLINLLGIDFEQILIDYSKKSHKPV